MWQARRKAAFKPISPRIYHHYNIFLPAGKAGRRYARQGAWRQRGLPQGVALPLPSDDAEGTKNQWAAHGLPPDGRSAKRGCLERPRGLADARKAPGLVFLCSVPKQRPPHSGDKPRVFRALRRYARQSRCAFRAQAEKRLALAEALVAECTGHAITPDAIVDRSSSVYSPRGGFVRGHRQIRHGPLSRAAPCRGGKMDEADILRNRRCAFAACAATLGLRGATAGRIEPRGLAEAGILRNLRCALAACAATPFNGAQWFLQAVPRGPRIRAACPAGYGPGRLWRRGCFPAPRRDRQSGRAFCAAWMLPTAAQGRVAYSRRHTGPWPGQNR